MAFTQPLHVLHVDDDEADRHLTRAALRRVRSSIEVHPVSSVDAAKRYLRAEGAFADAERPVCIILDMQLTDGTGADLLNWMSEQDELCHIPVIMFSGSTEIPDHANITCRLTKPSRLTGYQPLQEALGSILFAAADSQIGPANDNFAA